MVFWGIFIYDNREREDIRVCRLMLLIDCICMRLVGVYLDLGFVVVFRIRDSLIERMGKIYNGCVIYL